MPFSPSWNYLSIEPINITLAQIVSALEKKRHLSRNWTLTSGGRSYANYVNLKADSESRRWDLSNDIGLEALGRLVLFSLLRASSFLEVLLVIAEIFLFIIIILLPNFLPELQVAILERFSWNFSMRCSSKDRWCP